MKEWLKVIYRFQAGGGIMCFMQISEMIDGVNLTLDNY